MYRCHLSNTLNEGITNTKPIADTSNIGQTEGIINFKLNTGANNTPLIKKPNNATSNTMSGSNNTTRPAAKNNATPTAASNNATLTASTNDTISTAANNDKTLTAAPKKKTRTTSTRNATTATNNII